MPNSSRICTFAWFYMGIHHLVSIQVSWLKFDEPGTDLAFKLACCQWKESIQRQLQDHLVCTMRFHTWVRCHYYIKMTPNDSQWATMLAIFFFCLKLNQIATNDINAITPRHVCIESVWYWLMLCYHGVCNCHARDLLHFSEFIMTSVKSLFHASF